MNLKIIRLLCDNIAKQKHFYVEKLGLPLVSSNEVYFSVQAGKSLLEFSHKPDFATTKTGYYHFAFNIVPGLLESSAKDYLASRNIPLLQNDKNESFIEFSDWNARSVYFYDAEENILEFIARYNLEEPLPAPNFNINHIHNISEIGIPVHDNSDFARVVKEKCGATPWRDYGEMFKVLGDEHGLLLAPKLGRVWLPNNVKPTGLLSTEVTIEGKGQDFTYEEDTYRFNFVH